MRKIFVIVTLSAVLVGSWTHRNAEAVPLASLLNLITDFEIIVTESPGVMTLLTGTKSRLLPG